MTSASMVGSHEFIINLLVDAEYHGLAGAIVEMERGMLVCIANQVRSGETRFISGELFYNLSNWWMNRQVFERLVECEPAQIVFVLCPIPETKADWQFFGWRVDITVDSFLSAPQLLGCENVLQVKDATVSNWYRCSGVILLSSL
jgi:hypothetical protein